MPRRPIVRKARATDNENLPKMPDVSAVAEPASIPTKEVKTLCDETSILAVFRGMIDAAAEKIKGEIEVSNDAKLALFLTNLENKFNQALDISSANYYIYKVTCSVENNEHFIYLGITNKSIKNIWACHVNSASTAETPLAHQILKLGKQNFHIDELEKLASNDLARHLQWLMYYKYMGWTLLNQEKLNMEDYEPSLEISLLYNEKYRWIRDDNSLNSDEDNDEEPFNCELTYLKCNKCSANKLAIRGNFRFIKRFPTSLADIHPTCLNCLTAESFEIEKVKNRVCSTCKVDKVQDNNYTWTRNISTGHVSYVSECKLCKRERSNKMRLEKAKITSKEVKPVGRPCISDNPSIVANIQRFINEGASLSQIAKDLNISYVSILKLKKLGTISVPDKKKKEIISEDTESCTSDGSAEIAERFDHFRKVKCSVKTNKKISSGIPWKEATNFEQTYKEEGKAAALKDHLREYKFI